MTISTVLLPKAITMGCADAVPRWVVICARLTSHPIGKGHKPIEVLKEFQWEEFSGKYVNYGKTLMKEDGNTLDKGEIVCGTCVKCLTEDFDGSRSDIYWVNQRDTSHISALQRNSARQNLAARIMFSCYANKKETNNVLIFL